MVTAKVTSRVTRVDGESNATTLRTTRQIIKREESPPAPPIKTELPAPTPPPTPPRSLPTGVAKVVAVPVAEEVPEAAVLPLEAAVAEAEAPPGGTTMTSMCSQASAPEIS